MVSKIFPSRHDSRTTGVKLSQELREKVRRQIEGAGLPTSDAIPFVPLLGKNKRGDLLIEKASIRFGPKKDKRGFVDTSGRIWIKDRAHAGDPDHWDVQIDGGKDYIRVDLDGNLLPYGEDHMELSKNKTVKSRGQSAHAGLAASGVAGSWTVNIDEALSGADKWFAQIEGPNIYLYIQIPSPEIVRQALLFVEKQATRNGRWTEAEGDLRVGMMGRSPVVLRADDEFTDRFFLVIGPAAGATVHFTLCGEDLQKLVVALRQVQEDLEA